MTIRTQIHRLAVLIAVTSFSPGWAQADDAVSGMNTQSQQQDGALGVPTPKADRDMHTMEGMDHSGMNHTLGGSEQSTQSPGIDGMDHGEMEMLGGSAPSNARDPHEYSGGYTLDAGPYALPGTRQLRLADEHNFAALLFDRLERVDSRDGPSTTYDAQGWFGRTYDRLVIKAEGDIANDQLREASTELLWGHAIATFWDTQLGVRYDSGEGPNRGWLAFGVQGLAPYWFEIDAAAYIGENGRTALGVEAEYELLMTQKLILQPRLEANLYGKRDPAREIGKGFSDLAVGLRMRYEFRREFAPYLGVEKVRKFGETADIASAAGEVGSETRWVAGVRFWF